jgi:hypothetical protein
MHCYGAWLYACTVLYRNTVVDNLWITLEVGLMGGRGVMLVFNVAGASEVHKKGYKATN